jgi:hypothetical protein
MGSQEREVRGTGWEMAGTLASGAPPRLFPTWRACRRPQTATQGPGPARSVARCRHHFEGPGVSQIFPPLPKVHSGGYFRAPDGDALRTPKTTILHVGVLRNSQLKDGRPSLGKAGISRATHQISKGISNSPTQTDIGRLNQPENDRAQEKPLPAAHFRQPLRGDANTAQIWSQFASRRTCPPIRSRVLHQVRGQAIHCGCKSYK